MHKTYEDNEIRFKRDYVGKTFSGVLPFKSADENLLAKGTYSIGFGSGLMIPDILYVVMCPTGARSIRL
jgi:hypothetical protein